MRGVEARTEGGVKAGTPRLRIWYERHGYGVVLAKAVRDGNVAETLLDRSKVSRARASTSPGGLRPNR